MTADGVVTWTTPVGDRFTTWPVDHLGTRGLLAADAAHPAGVPAVRHSHAAHGHPARAIQVHRFPLVRGHPTPRAVRRRASPV